jgi:hypothetical protein
VLVAKPSKSVGSFEFIERFHARGMRQLHALDVRFAGERRVFQREIWVAKDGRLLVRFRCPTESDYDEALEIKNLTLRDLTQSDLDATGDESADDWPRWVPECVRAEWDLWLSSVI